MTLPKKYNTATKWFVLFLTIQLFAACSTTGVHNTRVEAHKIAINATLPDDNAVKNHIEPYKDSITRSLSTVLAYAPETFDKSKGKWNTTIGNMLAEATFERADKLFYSKEKLHADACMLNHGGIRSIIPKGPVTLQTAYEIMPFENSVKVIALKGIQIREMAAYIAREGRPHPLAGITITLDTNNQVTAIAIQGKPIENDKTYYIASIDYLIGGGDNMAFFATNEGVYDLNYKLRDLYIDYFKEVDTLPVLTTQHIITR
jgi:2',3'-cyclic-nucleotide 2'-phosphodiesterase (5'-nucleotidase family)